jgi:hypothetical protein
MGQTVDYYCTAYEESASRLILYYGDDDKSEKTLLSMGNYITVDIRKVGRESMVMPNYMKFLMYSLSFPADNRILKEKIAVQLGAVAEQSLRLNSRADLETLFHSLGRLLPERPETIRIEKPVDPSPARLAVSPDYPDQFVCVPSGIVRKDGGFESPILAGLPFGAKVAVLDFRNGWFKIQTTNVVTGWIYKNILVGNEEELKAFGAVNN